MNGLLSPDGGGGGYEKLNCNQLDPLPPRTHIDLRLTLLADGLKRAPDGMIATSLDRLGDCALPSIMRKIVIAAARTTS